MGKGSNPRPIDVDAATYASNWDRIFGSKERDAKEGDFPNSELEGIGNGRQEAGNG